MPHQEFPWKEVLAHAERLLQLVGQSATRGVFPVTPSATIHIVGMFWRAHRLYDGVLVLLKAELPEESMILARSIFEVSLRLQQLEAEPHNRNLLILSWVNHSITQQSGLLHVAKTFGLDTDIDEADAKLEAHRKQNRAYADEFGIRQFKPFLRVKAAAEKFGRKDEYWTYEWAHESVHGTDAAWMFARRRPAVDMVGLFAKTGDPSLRSSFAHFAVRSMVDAAKATFSILGWTLPPELEQTVSDIEQLLDSTDG